MDEIQQQKWMPGGKWTVRATIDYLDYWQMSIVIDKNGPQLQAGKIATREAIETVLPQLRANRDAILDYFQNGLGAKPSPRGRIFRELIERAGTREVWLLIPVQTRRGEIHGRPELYAGRRDGLPIEVRYAAAAGDASWTDLEADEQGQT